MQKAKLIILIVDDSVSFIERLIALLYEVDCIGYINVANDYDQALVCLEKEKPDVIFLDINMPGKTGLNLLATMKDLNMDSKVIMLTNHADDYYREQCTQLGAHFFLDKTNDFALAPMIVDELASKMDKTTNRINNEGDD